MRINKHNTVTKLVLSISYSIHKTIVSIECSVGLAQLTDSNLMKFHYINVMPHGFVLERRKKKWQNEHRYSKDINEMRRTS